MKYYLQFLDIDDLYWIWIIFNNLMKDFGEFAENSTN